MANKSSNQTSNQSGGQAGGQSGNFPLDNLTFDLVTLTYEKSKGLEAYNKYAQDAQGNQQVADLIERMRQQDHQHVQELRQVLGQMLGGQQGQQSGQQGGQQSGAMAGGQSSSASASSGRSGATGRGTMNE
jgi:ferritin-like metal-binding protein YciE